MSRTLDIQHFVFSTKHRRPSIASSEKEALYRFIWAKLKERSCHLYRINGMRDHVHMVVDLHPDVSKAALVKEIKSLSSQWMKKSGLYPDFKGWGNGFFSESVSRTGLEGVIAYVRNQEEHHRVVSFAEELQKFYRDNGLVWHELELQ